MISLQDILYRVPIVEMNGDTSIQVSGVAFDSRKVESGGLFVAIRGTQVDGHDYIEKALERGAVAVVCEAYPQAPAPGITWVRVKDSSLALSWLAANFYGNPAQELKIVGVTGTNGKTTCTTLLHDLTTALGYPAGLLSTVEVRIGKEVVPATHTTPDALAIQRHFRNMVDAGCEFCFMEVSSHALVQNRVTGIPFAGGVFTNLTQDHLDYHKTFAEYLQAKKLLFDGLPSGAFALTNPDDRNGMVMLQNSKARHITYALKKPADYKAKIIENTFQGLLLDVNGTEVWFRMIGSFNAYNLLAAYAVAVELGMDSEEVLLELSKIEGVNGRFQTLRAPELGLTAVVDYAHTPDALKNVLDTIQDINQTEGRVITLVGCGGDRDKGKRPLMGRIAAERSDQVIITSDNPRSEEPAAIIREIETGVPISLKRKVLTIENRREAIAAACRLAQNKDIILVAGKGHETYQEINGVKHPFDDRLVLLENFKLMSS